MPLGLSQQLLTLSVTTQPNSSVRVCPQHLPLVITHVDDIITVILDGRWVHGDRALHLLGVLLGMTKRDRITREKLRFAAGRARKQEKKALGCT